MATPTGPTAGRKAEVSVSDAASSDYTTATYVAVERVNSPSLVRNQKKAPTSSNDSNGNEEEIPTWQSAKFTFEMVANALLLTTGQKHLWDMAEGEIRAFMYQPTGDVSGDIRYRFLGSIDDIEDMGPKDGARAYKVSVTRTGGYTRDVKP